MTGSREQSPPDIRMSFARHNLSWLDLAPWVVIVGAYFMADGYLPLGTQIIIMIIFALSLDLILGYGGVESLGHAALFGAGSYAAGLFALRISSDPISGILVAGLAGMLTGLITGPLILRVRGITLVMMSLAVATVMLELANSWRSVTGGADGLYGFTIAPLFGRFDFDLFGRTGYWYSAAVFAVVFILCKIVVNSPFGLTIRGIRENPVRMRLLGIPVLRRLVMMYAISGFCAGLAGGLSAQVTQLVGLDSFSFVLSGNVLVMLILGGTGSLNGAIIGATIFVLIADRAAAISPFHWLFALGIALILTVRFAPGGLVGFFQRRGS